MSLRFGTDGIRGVANAELTPEIALAIGRAAARRMGGETFLVGRDTRRSGPMLLAALAAGLSAEGASVVDLGVLPTPALAWLAANRAQPAAMISASHNPYADNGIKLLSKGGTKLAEAMERAVEDELDLLVSSPSGASATRSGEVGEIRLEHEAVSDYADYLVGSIRLAPARRLKVVCDCANGAASEVAPLVLSRLGIEAVVVAADPDGVNINAGCGSTYAAGLGPAVVAAGADLGLAFDGDADRLIALDHLGQVVDGDHLLAMFSLDLHRRGELAGNGMVVTVMSNLGLRRSLSAAGIRVVETPVGDRHVADALEREGLVLGGEQSGHVIFAREATTGDGLLTALKLLELVAREGRPLSELAAESMRRLPQQLVTVAVERPRALAEAELVWREVAAVEAELGDAGRVLLRPSGTESAVRVMVEADSPEIATVAVKRLVEVVERELGSLAPR